MNNSETDRLVFLLETTEREGLHLLGTTRRLFSVGVDADWVAKLENEPVTAERVDAFGARFSRMQDTMGDKLIPELRRRMAETPGAALDNLNYDIAPTLWRNSTLRADIESGKGAGDRALGRTLQRSKRNRSEC